MTLHYDLRATANKVAGSVSPAFSVLYFTIPLFSLLVMFIACNYLGVSKLVLLFTIVTFLMSFVAPYLEWVFTIIAVVLALLPVFVFKNATWLYVMAVGIIGMIIGYKAWWKTVTDTAQKALMSDESLFESLWKAKHIALSTDSPNKGLYTYGSGRK